MSLVLAFLTSRCFLSGAVHDRILARPGSGGHWLHPPWGRARSTPNSFVWFVPVQVQQCWVLQHPVPPCNSPYLLLLSLNVSSIFPPPQFNYMISYASHSKQPHISSFLYALATYSKSVWNLIPSGNESFSDIPLSSCFCLARNVQIRMIVS